MNPELTNEEWFNAWSEFLKTIEGIFKKKEEYVKTDKRRATGIAKLIYMLDYLLNLLHQELPPEQAHGLLNVTSEMQGGRDAIVITGAEMIYVNRQYDPAQLRSAEEADEGIESAKTVKDSIEKLFKFVPKHKSILHGLNEILSLGRAI